MFRMDDWLITIYVIRIPKESSYTFSKCISWTRHRYGMQYWSLYMYVGYLVGWIMIIHGKNCVDINWCVQRSDKNFLDLYSKVKRIFWIDLCVCLEGFHTRV